MFPDSGGPPALSPKTGWKNASAATRGVMLMVASTIGFSAMHTEVRYLALNSEMHPIQIAFFRNLFGVLVFMPLIFRHGLGFLRTERLPMHGLRGVLNVLAMFAFFTGLGLAPLARVNALAFSAPLFAALLSVVILGERFQVRRWTAIVIGFLGTLVILRPGIAPIDTGSLLVLMSAGIWGVTMIVIRVLGRTESSLTTTGYMNIFLTTFSLLPAIYLWETPTGMAWFWLVVIGITGTLAQLALAEALKIAETTVVMPFDFLKIVWASTLGFILFSEVPDFYTFIGAAIIFTSTFYIAWRERQVGS